MKHQLKKIRIGIIVIAVLFGSCKKYLDKQADAEWTTPKSISDLQGLLDSYFSMSTGLPYSLEIGIDDYYVRDLDWASITDQTVRDQYNWQRTESKGWNLPYSAVLNANTVLDNLGIIQYDPASEQMAWNGLKGTALFYRAYYFYFCAAIFGQPYDKTTASNDLGIPLRLNSDFNEVSTRATVRETYDRIITDLKEAMSLLPDKQLLKTRPTRPAAYGALAKAYLAMQQYDSAGRYADLCITLYGDSLLNFNVAADVNIPSNAPFKQFNREVVFHIKSQSNGMLNTARAKIDSNLYNSYNTNDLRKTAYFKANAAPLQNTYNFKGDYDGTGTASGYAFAGIVMDEMYLIRAEAHARAGNKEAALQDLNKLMQTRWKNTAWVPFTATDAQDALAKILVERRKELFFRGTRWIDLRRLMKEPGYTYTPRRWLNGVFYDLVPNSPRYTLLIPLDVISLTGMTQNP